VPPDASFFERPDASWMNDPDLAIENQAQIDPASGSKIYYEAGKTVFANWSMIDPGQTAIITLKYRLPFKLAIENNVGFLDKITRLMTTPEKSYVTYSLLAQKQPGNENTLLSSTLSLDPESIFSARPVWSYPPNRAETPDNLLWRVNDNLNIDKFWAVILENK